MSDAFPNSPDEELVALVEAYCNGTISDEEFAQLEKRLRHDADARAFYRRYMSLHCALLDYGDNVGQLWNAASVEQAPLNGVYRVSPKKWVLAIAAVVLIGVVLVIVVQNQTPSIEPARVIARLEHTTGVVTIVGGDAVSRLAQPGVGIKPGDTIRTESSTGSALLSFTDGTCLSLVGYTSLTCSDHGRKSVIVHGGTLFASVTRQPAGKPMLLITPQNRVEVLGTKFSLTATSDETQVAVDEGRVRLTRLSDGKTVDVPAGRRVISNAHSDLALQKAMGTPTQWSEDFESGLPTDWVAGKFIFLNAPMGSKGGVVAVRRRDSQREYFQIGTPAYWAKGLFAAHEDSHLHFTCRMQNPGQVNIFVLTRTKGDPPAFSSNYLFDQADGWPRKPGQWFTITIPLAKFRRLSPGQVPIHDVVPFQILFSSPEVERGLVIDRVWVTRGGPDVVETKSVR